jgi:hypothetical protein
MRDAGSSATGTCGRTDRCFTFCHILKRFIMSTWRNAFPSKHIKADDLANTRPIVTIASVDFESVGTGEKAEDKLVCHFTDDTFKPLVLNMINSETIAEIAGTDQYESWVGVRIQLYATKTEFAGKRVPCIRISEPPTTKPRTPRPVTAAPALDTPSSEVDTNVGDVGF